jgi:hypothetical protein
MCFADFVPIVCNAFVSVSVAGQFFKLSQKSVIGLGKEKGGKLFLSIMAAPRA